MATKDSKPLSGFDVLGDFIIGSKNNSDNVDKKDLYQDIDPDDLDKKLKGDDDIDDKDLDDKDDKDNKDDKKFVDDKIKKDTIKKDDIVDDKKDIKDNKKIDDKDDSTDDEYESEISTFFASNLVKKLNIDVDEKDLKVNSIDEVIDLMSDIINENSKPTYANEEVEAYDEFVRNGGNLREFYKEVYANKLDLGAVDLEKEYDQKAVIRENLLNQGYKEDKIRKMIARYEEAETLKEEAEDSFDLLKEYNQKKAESLLIEQKNQAIEAQKKQQKFYNDVNSVIKTISDFRGFPVSEKEKRELLQYAFVPEEDGLTKYQKEFRGDVLNILESAYFVKNKDKTKKVDNAKDKGNSDAYKTLLEKIKAKGNKQVDNQNSNKLTKSSLGDFGKGIIFN